MRFITLTNLNYIFVWAFKSLGGLVLVIWKSPKPSVILRILALIIDEECQQRRVSTNLPNSILYLWYFSWWDTTNFSCLRFPAPHPLHTSVRSFHTFKSRRSLVLIMVFSKTKHNLQNTGINNEECTLLLWPTSTITLYGILKVTVVWSWWYGSL